MAYNELIKNFSGVRGYMREFFVYGFKNREEFDAKSARSYDNEKRRIESWLGDHMAFRHDADGKAVFLSMDSRHIPCNPLYKAWKASSFTKNDISLHFLLMDILAGDSPLTVPGILERIDAEYLPAFDRAEPIDESTLRKKLKEYTQLGLVVAEKQGKQLLYALPREGVDLQRWKEAIGFFAEDNPLGVVGSFLLDKLEHAPPIFSFKHRYLLFALDCGILYDLLAAIHARVRIEVEVVDSRGQNTRRSTTIPLRIFASVQGGRQYLAAYSTWRRRIYFYRLDSIRKVKPLEPVPDYNMYQQLLEHEMPHIWGVAVGKGQIEHIEMTLRIKAEDLHIAHRLEREKRCGTVERLSDTMWRFSADVYDAWELMPWLRTFIGRIVSLSCSNAQVERQFFEDYAALEALYGGDADAVQRGI